MFDKVVLVQRCGISIYCPNMTKVRYHNSLFNISHIWVILFSPPNATL
jgi:hypothetical protein